MAAWPHVRLLLLAVLYFCANAHGAEQQSSESLLPQNATDIIVVPLQQQTLPMNLPTWSAVFGGIKRLNLTMKQTQMVNLTISYIDPSWGPDFELHVLPEDGTFLHVAHVIRAADIVRGANSWSGNFSVEALFLGQTSVYVELRRPHMHPERSAESLEVIIMRNENILDTIFKVTLGAFVLVMYVNFGAVLDLKDLKRIILRPVGPAIGFIGQFVIMPLLSYGIGYLMFRDMTELRLGLLFTGCTPGGGFSNILTVVLDGNINLSVTMTAISNLAAFGMMPLWIFTLGSLILEDGNFAIPYNAIAMMSFSLLLPLCIGVALQRFAPSLTKKLSKHLQPISLGLVVFIMVFAFSVNSYLFKLFTWKIIISCSALPWLGYLLGWIVALICRQSAVDALTIAIETGIQNTGIAIFMLKFALPQPEADITSAVPVANSVLTPLPLIVLYVVRKGMSIIRSKSKDDVEEQKNDIKQLPATTKEAQIETITDKGHVNLGADL